MVQTPDRFSIRFERRVVGADRNRHATIPAVRSSVANTMTTGIRKSICAAARTAQTAVVSMAPSQTNTAARGPQMAL